jgi:TonB-dependent SusC/RagA subfamily outer membrane receptor
LVIQPLTTKAQQKTSSIKGVVHNVKNEPLSGVSVIIRNAKNNFTSGTNTDSAGVFTFSHIPIGGPYSFSFSMVGYEPQNLTGYTIKEDATFSLVVEMKLSAASTMEQVVVVGYGAQKKSLVTGAISSVKAEDIASISSSRVEQALQGRTAGVTVLPASGSPGSGMNVRIRGAGSNGSSQPLYIIDGVRAGGIEYLDPSEIASVEVLKDAASAAIYGAEGANGVVIITTKTGKRNTSEIMYSAQYGRQSVKDDLMPMMNAQQYQEYLQAANAPIRPTAAEVAGVNGTKWFNEIFQKAPLMRHSLALSGGTEKSTYLLDGTYFNQDGIVGGDKSRFTRYTLRVNTDHKIKSWLNVGEKLSYSNFK